MSYHPLLASLVLFAATLLPGGAQVIFRPVPPQPGKSVRVLSLLETPGGRYVRTNLAGQSGGPMSITRKRDMVWTFREPENVASRRGMLHVRDITTQTVTKVGSRDETTTQSSQLNGRMLAVTREPGGEWKLEPSNPIPTHTIQEEIDEIKLYLQRNWYPARSVVVGDSWEFDPAWVKYLIHRDVHKAQVIGTMKLRQLRNSESGRSALVDFTITGSGEDLRADGTKATATISLRGQLTINLQTMLEESMVANGTLETSVGKAIEGTTTTLPVSLRVTRTFVDTP